MAIHRGALIGLIVGGLGAIAGITVPLLVHLQARRASTPAAATRSLEASVDRSGPYVIFATERASREYVEALAEGRRLHPEATEARLDPADLSPAAERLRATGARYAQVYLLPDELDVNLAWRWLKLTADVDADPFVDVRTGFVTGSSPAAAAAFVRRIAAAARGETAMPARFVDNLGPNSEAPRGSFVRQPGSFMVPVLAERLVTETLSHGPEGFTRERLGAMEGAGLVHYGGHGYPDRVVDSLSGVWVRSIRFAPSVFFNGACYTGVTHGWYEAAAHLAKRTVEAEHSFCLGVLEAGVVGYLAALHPDHGIPVYQEMELLATTGAPLGDLVKATHDGVALAAGGRLPELSPLADGAPWTPESPAEVMLKGTASRVLFGDPAFRAANAFAEPPFEIASRTLPDGALAVEARVRNAALRSSFTQTYYSDLSATGQFNDRALVSCPLPDGAAAVRQVAAIEAEADGRPVPARLAGFGVEEDAGRSTLHVLVDLPSTGYQQGPIRRPGAIVRFRAEP